MEVKELNIITLPLAYKFGLKRTEPLPVVRRVTFGGE